VTAVLAAVAPLADPTPRRHGQRLLEAIVALERFPALAYSRRRLLEVLDGETESTRETIAVIESDPALAMGALSLANRRRPKGVSPICGIPEAVVEVGPSALRAFARDLTVSDFFGQGGTWNTAAGHFRVHAVATRWVVERLIRDGLAKKPDHLRVAALLHDVGKLVLLHAYGRYMTGSEGPPCDRLLLEQRAWGLDHALAGGVFARRLAVPNAVATLIEHHHSPDGGDAGLLRLADLLVHYSAGNPIKRTELVAVAESCGLDGAGLDALLYDFPVAAAGPHRMEPSPLTPRQTAVLRLLSKGNVYKQIADELGLSTSTVRSHLHAVYTKLGVADRAQAVVLAMNQGWLS
jgi:DNA-binding CsgD family transcriptional regulator/HD-like signal output (HDOD) protein